MEATKRILAGSNEKLADDISNAYKETLKHHHGFIAKTAVKLSISKTCPTRQELFNKLGQDKGLVTSILGNFNRVLERILHILKPFLEREGIKF